jgi:hypothetical protein
MHLSGEERHNALIFIGRNLNREELNAGFNACMADVAAPAAAVKAKAPSKK